MKSQPNPVFENGFCLVEVVQLPAKQWQIFDIDLQCAACSRKIIFTNVRSSFIKNYQHFLFMREFTIIPL
jgi:hypothetical protein